MSKRLIIIALAALFVLLAGPTDLPMAPQAHVVTVSEPGGHYTEPGLAINPKDPRQVVAVFQGGKRVQGTATALYSTDGGLTFAAGKGTDSAGWRVLGDVTTAFDNKGNVYLCSIAFDHLGTSGYWAHNVHRNGIIVRRSQDGGKTWQPAVSNVQTFTHDDDRNIQFEDEPRIFADNNPASPYAGSLYVGWVEWQLTQSVMYFSRSKDQAKTWSTPLRISTRAGLPRDDNGGLGGYHQAIAADGAIYAIWDDAASIVMTTSHDGGASFAPSRPIVPIGPPYFGDVPGVARVEGFPQIAIERRRGGKLFVCWSDYSNGDVDVFVAASVDQGRTWGRPLRVNDDPIHNGIDQFYQWMALDPITGAIYVDFYDRRGDADSNKARVTLARSTDGGRSFRNYAWTTAPFNPLGAFLGDYTWIDAYNNHVVAAWTETETAATRASATTVIKVGSADFTHAAP